SDIARDRNGIHIITDPNMGGKSTYLRQVALIVLLNQAGSFVPASKETLGIFDRIFTRVGASDQLARGASTFMVEMHETANILDTLERTERDLVEETRPSAPRTSRQLGLFGGDAREHDVVNALRAIEVEALTPIQALNELARLKAKLEE